MVNVFFLASTSAIVTDANLGQKLMPCQDTQNRHSLLAIPLFFLFSLFFVNFSGTYRIPIRLQGLASLIVKHSLALPIKAWFKT